MINGVDPSNTTPTQARARRLSERSAPANLEPIDSTLKLF
jgi:hypothetical protein